MTIRQVGEAGIKLLGVYFAASALVGTVTVLASFAVPSVEGLPTPGELAAYNALSLAASILVAGLCLFGGTSLASRLFVDQRIDATPLSRRDLLVIGVALLGLSIALSGVPGIIQTAAKAVWYAEGSRQSMFWPAMRQSADLLTNSILAFVVGSGTAMLASRLASAIDARVDTR